MNIYIFDLDSTLANIDHRLPHLHTRDDGPDAPFNALCIHDTPIKHMLNILDAIVEQGRDWRIWTGRTEGVRQQTIEWLVSNTILHHFELEKPQYQYRLKMRPLGDTRPDYILKQEWLHALEPDERKCVACAFDDRDRVVKMYRSNGVPCLQVAEGNF